MVREGVVIFTGALAKHLAKVLLIFLSFFTLFPFVKQPYQHQILQFTFILHYVLWQDDPKVHAVIEKLLDVLNTPSEAVQRAVSTCLSPLMQSKQV